MKSTIFNIPLSSKKLRENMTKQFGVAVNLGKYSREQLEDIRNKLRTKISQHESGAGINDLLTNETYQKDKAMLLKSTKLRKVFAHRSMPKKPKVPKAPMTKTATVKKTLTIFKSLV